MNLGKWKTVFYRFWAYIALFTYPNTVLIAAGYQVDIWLLLLIEVVPVTIFVWKFDLGKVFVEEMRYQREKDVLFMENYYLMRDLIWRIEDKEGLSHVEDNLHDMEKIQDRIKKLDVQKKNRTDSKSQ